GFFHLARVEETSGPRDEHGRFRAEWSCLDPLDPPLERLRRKLGVAPDGPVRFTVALTHDVDAPWRWTRIGVRGAAAGLKEVGLHGSYAAADDPVRLAAEKQKLEALAGPVAGHRYHYLRVDPHRNLAPLEAAGLRYDTTLGFPDAIGFRAGIARPFRPWDFERDEPLDLVEIPLAAMDATLADERYLGLAAKRAEPQLMR